MSNDTPEPSPAAPTPVLPVVTTGSGSPAPARRGGVWLGALALLLATPLLGWQYGLGEEVMGVLLLSLALGTPSLCVLAALGAALTLGLRGALLLVLVVLPLSVPILIFGSHAVTQSLLGLPAAPALNLLGACLCLALLAGPWAIAAALRLALE